MLFTELKTQNNEIDSILEESHWVLLIPDPLLTARAYEPSYRSMDPGSVILTVGVNTITRGHA